MKELKHCLSVDWTCEKLVIYPSNQNKPDQCIKFNVWIDRDRSRKPVRCDECLKQGL